MEVIKIMSDTIYKKQNLENLAIYNKFKLITQYIHKIIFNILFLENSTSEQTGHVL